MKTSILNLFKFLIFRLQDCISYYFQTIVPILNRFDLLIRNKMKHKICPHNLFMYHLKLFPKNNTYVVLLLNSSPACYFFFIRSPMNRNYIHNCHVHLLCHSLVQMLYLLFLWHNNWNWTIPASWLQALQ